MILITRSNTWNSSSEVCSGRTISGLHIGPSACELKNSQWILLFFLCFTRKSRQKIQFLVPAGCKAYQWVQYSQTLYCFIPRLVPKWENQGKRSSLFKDQTVQLKRFPIFLFSRASIGIRRLPHIFPRIFLAHKRFLAKNSPPFLLDEIKWTFIPCMRKNKAEFNKSNYTNSWSNLWNTSLIVSFKASSRLSSASTSSASFSSIAAVQYRLNPFFCDCRVYSSGILRTESGISSW